MLAIETLSSRDLMASNILTGVVSVPPSAESRRILDCEGSVFLTTQTQTQAYFNPKEFTLTKQVPWQKTPPPNTSNINTLFSPSPAAIDAALSRKSF